MLWLLACAPEYGLHTPVQPVDPIEAWDEGLIQVEPTEGSAEAVLETPDRRTEVFDLGGTPRIDVLFVLDESISMADDLNALRSGMASLVLDGAWPDRTRIAVTSTTPASADGARRRHAAVTQPAGLPSYFINPGFQRLVDRGGIEAFRPELDEDRAGLYALDGCEAWFAPDERNAQGIPCLLANTQIGLLPTRVEAGTVALKQLLQRSWQPLFRQGSAVNVVFVSDTHDPGFFPWQDGEQRGEQFDELIGLQPSFEELRGLAQGELASFQVHAIAPDGSCGETSYEEIGLSYFDLVEQGGGLALDLCGAEDWTPLIARVAASAGRLDEPMLVLESTPSELWSVTLDGGAVGYAQDERMVVLDAQPRAGVKAEVRYRR